MGGFTLCSEMIWPRKSTERLSVSALLSISALPIGQSNTGDFVPESTSPTRTPALLTIAIPSRAIRGPSSLK